MKYPRSLAAPLLLATSLVAPLSAQQGENWPFGLPADAGALAKKRDLFNLGLLGVKAWDADLPEPAAKMAGGRRAVASEPFDGNDDGPERLVVKALLGGGPGQQAGLQTGDVIVGVGRKKFAKAGGSFEPLADALLAAESKKGEVVLLVERDGKVVKVTCTIASNGAAAKKPTVGAQQRKIVDDACAFLAGRQQGDGGFRATLGGINGQVVNTCLAGLAWLAGGSTLDGGAHQDNLKKARDYVIGALGKPDAFGAAAGGDANWDQTNWRYAYAGIFLGELAQQSKDEALHAAVQEIATTLCARQEASGGFAHGPGGPNALGYLELNIVGGFVLSALGQCKRAGATFDEQVVERLVDYLEKSGGGSGGVAYSTKDGQIGQPNVGRTAVAWLGLVGMGQGGKPFAKKMKKWLSGHVHDVMGGHASLMQHIMLAGVAANALGSKAQKAYWKVLQRDLTLCRCPDGSIQMRPWHESLNMQSNSDVTMGQIWSTASWAIVLAADGFKDRTGGLPGWCGK
ncbi:MAG: DUF6288 domain-containing protein [Planctomycetota bacterium]